MRLALSMLVLMLCAGCAALRPSAEEAVLVSEIVDTAIDTARAPAATQHERLAAATETFASRPDDTSRLRLATLLATLPAPLRNDVRAVEVIEPLVARQPETPLVRFAVLLHAQLAERQRVAQANERALHTGEQREEALRRQVEALRAGGQREEAQRRHTGEQREEALRRQVEALRASERTMAEREETLRRQIEALRASERGMIEREGRVGAKAR